MVSADTMRLGNSLPPDTDTTYVAPMPTIRAQTTLGDLHRATPWLWLYCDSPHHAATRLRCPGNPLGRSSIERQATPLRSLHCLRTQGRDYSASRLGRCAHWVHAVPGWPNMTTCC